MKKDILVVMLLIITLLVLSCSPPHSTLPSSSDTLTSDVPTPSQAPVSEQSLPETKQPELVTEIPLEQKIPTPASATTPTQPAEKTEPKPQPTSQPTQEPTSTNPSSSLAPAIRTTPSFTPSPPISTAFDQFTGTTIYTTKYNTQLTGNASLIQNDKIIMKGNSNNGISWVSLYTTKKYSAMEEYNLSVDVTLNGSVSQGSAHTVIGLETLPILTAGKKPERNYCELRISNGDKILRMSKTINHLDPTTPLSGTLTIYWSKKLGKSTCTFNDQTITQYQDSSSGDYYGSIRSGLNYASEGGGIETDGQGDYSVTFDNFFIKQN